MIEGPPQFWRNVWHRLRIAFTRRRAFTGKTEGKGGGMYSYGECCNCLEYGLLKRTAICPGVLEVHRISLCLQCRVGWRDDGYACLAESLEFDRVARADWKAKRAVLPMDKR